jgi:hypothetical protein
MADEDVVRAYMRGGAEEGMAAAGAAPDAPRVSPETTMRSIVEGPALAQIGEGRALIVVDGDVPIGVVPAEAVREYLATRYNAIGTTLGGERGGRLGGLPVADAEAIICATCKTANPASSFDPDNPPTCVNEDDPRYGVHALAVEWS